jgi:hypothetical protein
VPAATTLAVFAMLAKQGACVDTKELTFAQPRSRSKRANIPISSRLM